MKVLHGLLLSTVLLGSAQVFAQTPIKIGFMAVLSGPFGAGGQDQQDAFMMVVERNGGKLGGVPVQILVEDTQLKPEVATQLAQKLIEKEKVPIITGFTFSNEVVAVHKPVTDKEVFLVVSNGGPSPQAGAQCSPYQFFTSWQNDMMAEVVGKYANDKGYKRVMALAPNYVAGKDFVGGFKRMYKGEIISETYTPLNQQDFAAEISQIAAAKPDALYIFYPGGLGINFIRQYQQAGLLGKIPLMSSGTVEGTTLPALRDTALGVLVGSAWGPDLDNASNKRFVEDFEKKFKRIPSQYAAQAYDSALLLDSAIAKVKGNMTDKKAFMAALREADFQSVRGKFRFNNNGIPIQDMHVFEVAKDAKGRPNLKRVATPFRDHEDAYHHLCPLK
ncbi:MAG: periplasmic binding domain protein [Noviherbaspirillum sp.]|nr:periplasmic binding domain protein [Noviherbaspirillum sp.]